MVAGGGVAPPTPGKDPGKLLLALSCLISHKATLKERKVKLPLAIKNFNAALSKIKKSSG